MFRPTLLSAICLAALASGAQAASLPIKRGAYVRDGVPCRDAPFAALMQYDGKSFSGPHESDCTTLVRGRPGPRTYLLKTTCRAAGDGTPNESYAETQTVKVLSRSHITFSHTTGAGAEDRAGYRFCPVVNPS